MKTNKPNGPQTAGDPLEQALEALRTQPIDLPSDLFDRCVATVPSPADLAAVQSSGSWRQRFENWIRGASRPRPRWALASALAVVLLICWIALPRAPRSDGDGFVPTSAVAGVAWAETVSTMRQVPFWYRSERFLDIDYGRRSVRPPLAGTPVKSARWKLKEEWFDAQRGYSMRFPVLVDWATGKPQAPEREIRQIQLPTGKSYMRGAMSGQQGVDILHTSPDHWKKLRLILMEAPGDPLAAVYARGDKNKARVSVKDGTWKGKPARVFTIERSLKHPHTLWDMDGRSLVYADPHTRRLLAYRTFFRWPEFPDKGEVLITEGEYDYASRIPDAVLDVKALQQGAKVINNLRLDPQGNIRDKEGNLVAVTKSL